MNNNELITKWSKTFLLEGIDKSKELTCAKTMEEVFQLGVSAELSKDKSFDSENFFSCIFPLVRRMYDRKDYKIPSADEIFNGFLQYYKKQYNVFKDICQFHAIDFESEMISFYLDICVDNKSDDDDGESLDDLLSELK